MEENMNKIIKWIIITIILSLAASQVLLSHCQVPCGIYDDQVRIKMMGEHITTMEKAMKQVLALSKATPVNYNQVVRWVTNKEKHGEELSQIVTYYFMTQRLKPASSSDTHKYSHYKEQLELLHHLLVYTMKAKQSTDLKVIETLRELLKKFEKAYFAK
jgi:nickel superoxide dismutase